ncbi:MAG TPA: hypothetical protein VH370_20960 [Humisphaera sp.]|jgi:hypothetical protein|nr:hypothetical protein [Humisphaera sp.]
MFRKALLGAVALLAGSAVVASAGPKDDVVAAAKKLADGGNYTWKTTTESAAQGGFTPGAQEGKTQKDGLTYTTQQFGDNTIETVRQGDKYAMKFMDAWASGAEMAARGGGGGGGGGRGRGGFGGFGANQPLPATQAAEQLAKIPDVTKEGDAYIGTVTGEAVREFGGRGFGGRRGGGGGAGGAGGQAPPPLKNAKATVKVWVKDGAISKLQVHSEYGTTNFQGDEVEVNQTRTTDFTNVGTTKVEIPAEAKAKLAE